MSLEWIEEDRLKPVYERGNAIVSLVMCVHCVLSIWLASIYNTWAVTAAVAIPATLLFFGMKQWRPYCIETRMAACLSLMTFCMLHIYQMYGLPEMHFFFFTTLVAMLAYRDHRALYPGVLLIIAQHVLMTLDGVKTFAPHFWGTREISPTVLAFHFGIALAATALAAHNMKGGRREYLETVQLANEFKEQAEELADAKAKLEADLKQRARLEDLLQQQMAELQTKAASLEFTNFSMMGELERLEDLATTDALTGLPNIASIRQILDHSLLLDANVSVIMMDIDHFKSHNDEHGHQHGDEVLKTVAQVIKGQLRTDEAIGRYGGEEFIIVLPNCPSDVALRVAERLRRSLEEFEWPVKAVTASFGISTRAEEFKVADQLIAEADEALYASKRNGRNRVTLGGLNAEAA
ncbi:MAG: hypothetical protein Fur0036_08780 [Fimbriimonadaceae bacterium]